MTPWLGAIISTGNFRASTSSIFLATSGLKGVRMLT